MKLDWETLDRYLAGEASADERAHVDRVFSHHQNEASILREFADRAVGEHPPKVDTHKAWTNFANQEIKTRRTNTPMWIGSIIAACAILIITWQALKPSTTTAPNKTYATAAGHRATIILQSGAQVTLGPATQLNVYNDKVVLSGEAVFTVLHKNDTPFTVQTENTITRVLGTAFAVRKYVEDKSAIIAVADGKVSANSVILSAGDIATTSSNNKISVKHDAEAMLNAFAFSQGKLVIEVQTLAEAAPELSRWLDLDVCIEKSAANQRLTTTLHHHTVAQALDQIALLTETRYHRNGRVVIFTRD